MTEISERRVERVACRVWPHLWDKAKFEDRLAGLSIFTPEQAAASAEKGRREKCELVRRVLEADRVGEQCAECEREALVRIEGRWCCGAHRPGRAEIIAAEKRAMDARYPA